MKLTRTPYSLPVAITLSFLAQSSIVLAQPAKNSLSTDVGAVTPYQVPFKSETIALSPSENGVRYQLYVRQPLRAPKVGEKAVTVYLLDALWNFPAVATILANAEYLGHLPPLLVVGVGYADDVDGGREENRVRDYTPVTYHHIPATRFRHIPASESGANKHLAGPQEWPGLAGLASRLDFGDAGAFGNNFGVL